MRSFEDLPSITEDQDRLHSNKLIDWKNISN